MVWISRNGSARVGASGIGQAISTWRPGTHLKKHLKRGDPGSNRLDRIAKQHDIDYLRAKTLKDKHVADRKMIRAIGHLPGRKTLKEHVVKKIKQTKTCLNL